MTTLKQSIIRILFLMGVTVTLPQCIQAQFRCQSQFDSSQSFTVGLYRICASGNNFVIQRNSSSDGSFGSTVTSVSVTGGSVAIMSPNYSWSGLTSAGVTDVGFGAGIMGYSSSGMPVTYLVNNLNYNSGWKYKNNGAGGVLGFDGNLLSYYSTGSGSAGGTASIGLYTQFDPNARTWSTFNSFSSPSNFESVVMGFNSNFGAVYTSTDGSMGTVRNLRIGAGGTQVEFLADGTAFRPISNNTYNFGDSTHAIHTGYINLLSMNGVTSGSVTFQPPTTVSSWTFTLPSSGGTSGYFLTTNGSGTTSWSPPPSGTFSGLTTNTLPKATSGTSIGDSSLSDDGTTVKIQSRAQFTDDGTNPHLTTSSGQLYLGDGSHITKIMQSLAVPGFSNSGEAWVQCSGVLTINRQCSIVVNDNGTTYSQNIGGSH